MTIAASVLLASLPLLVTFYANRFQEHDKDEAFRATTTDFGLPTHEEFDFIVVGAGAAGCVLARRLAEVENFTVLLLEAGGQSPRMLDVPLLSKFARKLPEVNFLFHSTPQKHAGLDRHGVIATPAGRMLGGSSAESDLIFQRGHPNDYDNWAKLTDDPTWGHQEIAKYFELVDKQMLWKLSGANIGDNGNKDVWLAAGKERGFEEMADASGIGFSTRQSFASGNGSHHPLNTYQAYIGSSTNLASRLTLRQYSLVSKILIENKRAEGVLYERHGVPRVAYAKHEVILSAGTYMTPLILTRSGIGPEKTLTEADIDPVAVLPVGENLMDHLTLEVGPFQVNPENFWTLQQNLTFRDLNTFEAFGNGSLSESLEYGKSVAFIASSRAQDMENRPTWPDLQIYYSNMSNDTLGVKCVVMLNRPYSRGRLDTDPKVKPVGHNSSIKLHYDYLSDASDVNVMIEGINFCLDTIENTEAFRAIGAKLTTLYVPGCSLLPYRSREYWECYVKEKVDSAYHAAGTCRMGKADDKSSVVDSKLRVLGVQNLRVADASIMPVITGAGTLAPTMMIAEKLAAELVSYYNKGAAGENSPKIEPAAPGDFSTNTRSRSLSSPNSFMDGGPLQSGLFGVGNDVMPQENQFPQPAQSFQPFLMMRQRQEQQHQFPQIFQPQFNQFPFPQQNGRNPMIQARQFNFQPEGPPRNNFDRPHFNNLAEGMAYRNEDGYARNGFNPSFMPQGPFPQQKLNVGPFYPPKQPFPFQNGEQGRFIDQKPSGLLQNMQEVNRYQSPWALLEQQRQILGENAERGQFYSVQQSEPINFEQQSNKQPPPFPSLNSLNQPMQRLPNPAQNVVPLPPQSQQQSPGPVSYSPPQLGLNPNSLQFQNPLENRLLVVNRNGNPVTSEGSANKQPQAPSSDRTAETNTGLQTQPAQFPQNLIVNQNQELLPPFSQNQQLPSQFEQQSAKSYQPSFMRNQYVPHQETQQSNQLPLNQNNFPSNPQFSSQRYSFYQGVPPPYLLPQQDRLQVAQFSRSLQQADDDEEASTATPANSAVSSDNFQDLPKGFVQASNESSTPSPSQPTPEPPVVLKNLLQDNNVLKVENRTVDPDTSSSSTVQVSSTNALAVVPGSMKSEDFIVQSAPNFPPSSQSAHVPSVSNISTFHIGSPMESSQKNPVDLTENDNSISHDNVQNNLNIGHNNVLNPTNHQHQYQAPSNKLHFPTLFVPPLTNPHQSHVYNMTATLKSFSHPTNNPTLSNSSAQTATELKPLLSHSPTVTPVHLINKRDVSTNSSNTSHAQRHKHSDLKGLNLYRIVE